jgi:hypothetical protein
MQIEHLIKQIVYTFVFSSMNLFLYVNLSHVFFLLFKTESIDS